MNFDESNDYLLALGNEVSAMKLGLESVAVLLEALGNPQARYIKLQVAGTNGKGSVCAYLNAVCLQAGLATGLYTSPHLVVVTERIEINGSQIDREKFAIYTTRVREACERLVLQRRLDRLPTFFEQLTAIALIAFAEASVDVAILETGLGGRLDATTAARAEFAAITRIDLDHQSILGESLAEIAGEKAGILRRESVAVIGEQPDEAMQILVENSSALGLQPRFARDVKASVSDVGREPLSTDEIMRIPRVSVDFRTTSAFYKNVNLNLLGRHQTENAKTAILAAEELKRVFPITVEHIINGLEAARHPGRLEVCGRFLLDGAHNVGGAAALRDFIAETVNSEIVLVFGVMRDKNAAEMLEILAPLASRLILTRPSGERAMTPNELLELLPDDVERNRVSLTENVREAIDAAREQSAELILVTGSLYLVGEVKQIFARA